MGDSDIKTWGLVILLALGGMWQISKTVTGSSLNKARAMDAAASTVTTNPTASKPPVIRPPPV